MSKVRILNLNKDTILAENAEIADNFFQRLRGLIGRLSLESGDSFILTRCNSVHTFFMRFAIDVAFVDRQNRIIKIYSSLRSWRLSSIHLNSVLCIELPAGTLSSTHTQEGDYLQLLTGYP